MIFGKVGSGTVMVSLHRLKEILCCIFQTQKMTTFTLRNAREKVRNAGDYALYKEVIGIEIKIFNKARVSLRVARPLFCYSYSKNRNTGNLILFDDEAANETVAAGIKK